MGVKITGRYVGQVDAARFSLPGVEASDLCPRCGRVAVRCFDHDPLVCPLANTPFDIWMICQACHCEWKVRVVLTIRLDLESVVDQVAGLDEG